MMRNWILLATTIVGAAFLFGRVAIAGGDLSAQPPVEVAVHLGTKDGQLVFEPKDITFQTGKLYKLVLDDPSPSKHYFSALRFAAAIWTRKVETSGAEIKGSIREIELKPGGKAEWYFVPVQAGKFDLMCTVPGHAEAGMKATITVE